MHGYFLYMIVTLPYLQAAFKQYNHQIFEDKLPTPTLKLSRARTRLGQMAYKRKTSWGQTKYYDFTIGISTAFDLSQKELDDVIIHEMIHYYIAYTGLKDSSAHGNIFRSMMETINRRHSRNITITAKRKGLQQPSHDTSPYLVLALIMEDGKHFLSSVTPGSAHKIASQLAKVKEIKQKQWFITNDNFFANMPRVRTLRGRLVEKEEYQEITSKLEPLTECL